MGLQFGNYSEFGRFTNPKQYQSIIEQLPSEIEALGQVVRNSIVHHNLLVHHNITFDERQQMKRVWPPSIPKLLETLSISGRNDLLKERPIKNKIMGACIFESHLLASLLKANGFQARVRAGYFKNVTQNAEHVVNFWLENGKGRRINHELFQRDPVEWEKQMLEFTNRQIEVDHRIEHWVCEILDNETQSWIVLDANTDFLKVTSDIEVTIFLPSKHYEFAHEAWYSIIRHEIEKDRYQEDPQDGYSHVRSQLLLDFYSLLNFDTAGFGGDQEKRLYEFIKERKYDELSSHDLSVLNEMADLLSSNPTIELLNEFYWRHHILQFDVISNDEYSFVNRK